MKYRPEIDGLRAVAVLPVIFFHAGLDIFSGGYAGVDIFFVISGFLITNIILNERSSGVFLFRSFYERRARRILPALFFVMSCCIPLSWLLMFPDQYKEFSHSLIAVIFFASNILFWMESGYFEKAAEQKPLLHTWSLAIEEQYYIFFPIVILLLWRLGKLYLIYLLALVTVISLGLSEYASRYHPQANFYLIPTRAWELLAGSLAAFMLFQQNRTPNKQAALLGLVMIISSFFLFDANTRWPSAYTLLPVMGTVLVLLYCDNRSLVYRILSCKGFVGIGLISYSAYLWHQPLFAFARLQHISALPTLELMLGLTLLSLLLAYFTWKYIETPFRKRQSITLKNLVALSSIGAITFIVTGLHGRLSDGRSETWLASLDGNQKTVFQLMKLNDNSNVDYVNDCIFKIKEITESSVQTYQNCKEKHGKGVAIIGDSHGEDLFGALAKQSDIPAFMIGVSSGGCRPHNLYDRCYYDDFQSMLVKHDLFHTVIYEQAGFYLLQDQTNHIHNSREIFIRFAPDEPIGQLDLHEKNLLSVLNYLDSFPDNINVIWLGPRLSHHLTFRHLFYLGCDAPKKLRPGLKLAFESIDSGVEQLKGSLEINNVTYISQLDAYKFNPTKDILDCKQSLWSDGDHWSPEGELYFGRKIMKYLKQEGFL